MKALPFLLAVLLFACSQPTDHVIESFENGHPKVVYTYAGSDSLNRLEQHFHENGQVYKSGEMKDGLRDGKWQSFYENGSLWSVHFYNLGVKNGDFKTWHPNGQIHYTSHFKDGEKVGTWVFYTEQGDTAGVREMGPNN